jgi:hypothetical protein
MYAAAAVATACTAAAVHTKAVRAAYCNSYTGAGAAIVTAFGKLILPGRAAVG